MSSEGIWQALPSTEQSLAAHVVVAVCSSIRKEASLCDGCGCPRRCVPAAVSFPQHHLLAVQMVVTGCWLTVKEASLLLGSLASEAPIAKAGSGTAPLLAPAQLAEVGRQLMRFMGVIKHSGAVEKAQAGFIALCDRHAPHLCCKRSCRPNACL